MNGVVGCNGGGGERCGGDVVVVADGIGGMNLRFLGFLFFILLIKYPVTFKITCHVIINNRVSAT